MTTTTMATTPKTMRPSALLRAVLLVDGAGCIAMGGLAFPFTGTLAAELGLPSALITALGVYLLLYGAAEVFLGARPTAYRAGVLAVILLNAMWVLDSAIVLLTGWFTPTTAGVVTIAVLAVGVAGVTALQTYGYRRS